MRNILIKSNAKVFFAHPETGVNIGRTRYGSHVIQWFDLVEYIAYHGTYPPPEIDIIDIGYWYIPHDSPQAEPIYEPPVWHTREAQAA